MTNQPQKRLARFLILAGILAILALIAYLLFGPAIKLKLQRHRLKQMNVLLITLDTQRADHLGCYDSRYLKTPALDQLASEGVLFEKCLAQTPLTLPSHTTILSGTYPTYHRVRDNELHKAPAGLPLISETFHQAGYATAAFLGAFVLHRGFGLQRGFDLYADHFPSRYRTRSWGEIRKPAETVLTEARNWLEANRGQRFFSWIHLYDPHAPYEPSSPFRERFPDHPYRGCVAYMDAELGKFFDFLRQSGLWEKTLIVVAGDHGESLGEHGETTHGFFLYQETLRVPLLIRAPFRLPRQRVKRLVELVDVAPTLLEAAGLTGPKTIQGHSLLELVLTGRDESPEKAAYSETYYPLLHFGWSELKSLQQGELKFIQAPRQELYDLAADQKESRNLALERDPERKKLRGLLGHFVDASSREALTAENKGLDPQAREKLASLGYITSSAATIEGKNAVDPKDKIGVYIRLQQAKELFNQQALEEATGLARGILAHDPQVTEARILLATIYRDRNELAAAEEVLKAGLRINGDDQQLLTLLGKVLSAMGKHREALEVFSACLALDTGNPIYQNNLGMASWFMNDPGRAVAAFQRASELDPQYALPLANLGLLTLNVLSDPVKAEGYLLKALAVDPEQLSVHNALAGYYARTGLFIKAEYHWRRCVEIDRRFLEAWMNLLVLYGRDLRDRGKALDVYARLRGDFYNRLEPKDRKMIDEIGKVLN